MRLVHQIGAIRLGRALRHVGFMNVYNRQTKGSAPVICSDRYLQKNLATLKELFLKVKPSPPFSPIYPNQYSSH